LEDTFLLPHAPTPSGRSYGNRAAPKGLQNSQAFGWFPLLLIRYREAAPEALEKADGKKRRAVYNALGVTVWAAKAKGDPIKVVSSALGGEEVCLSDKTSTR